MIRESFLRRDYLSVGHLHVGQQMTSVLIPPNLTEPSPPISSTLATNDYHRACSVSGTLPCYGMDGAFGRSSYQSHSRLSLAGTTDGTRARTAFVSSLCSTASVLPTTQKQRDPTAAWLDWDSSNADACSPSFTGRSENYQAAKQQTPSKVVWTKDIGM